MNMKRTMATIGVAAMLGAPMLTAAPAAAAEREFRYGGAKVEFEVNKDDGRFEVEVDIDGKRKDRWRVKLWQNGNRYHNKVYRGDVDIDKKRPDTRGRDVFKLKVKKIGGPKAKTRIIRLR
jgi:Ni/Co efflux regulator RcnB